MSNGKEHRSNYDGWQQPSGQFVGELIARRRQADSDRGRIRVFTAELSHQSVGVRAHGTTAEEEAESQRLIEIAKRVLKDLHVDDVIWEHIIHNILFPNTRYTFVGITELSGNVRIVLSQNFCSGMDYPTDQEISYHLQSLGLFPEDHYYYGNEYLSVTDVGCDSDNVLKDESGDLFFIDPIIKLKKPAPQVIDWLLSDDCPMWHLSGTQFDNTSSEESTFIKCIRWFRHLFGKA